MHYYTNDHFGNQQVCMKWFHIKICMFLCLELPNLSSIILLCLTFLQNYELHTSELLLSELVALQEQLSGWLVDYIVKLGAEHSIL
jgi:hypothetical protein